uniref:Uncharacterized protein n=1 Tax=Anguilla anguilla TaxID=7936 RepID=A0A0E9RFT9_ANGAN
MSVVICTSLHRTRSFATALGRLRCLHTRAHGLFIHALSVPYSHLVRARVTEWGSVHPS